MVKIGPARMTAAPPPPRMAPAVAPPAYQPGDAPSEPDMSLLGELFEEIERNPPALEARKLLIEQYVGAGWIDAARDAAQELLKLKPRDSEMKRLVQSLKEVSEPEPERPVTRSVFNLPPPPPYPRPLSIAPSQLPRDREAGKQKLLEGYEALLEKAKGLLRETTLLRDLQNTNTSAASSTSNSAIHSVFSTIGSIFPLCKKKEDPIHGRFEKHVQDLVAITNGRVSTVVRVRQPGSVGSVARSMEASPQEAVDVAFKDLEETARWLSSSANSATPLDNDGVREALVKRVRSLETALSDSVKPHAATALMHIEHEVLRKKYIGGDTTMLGDPISDIERASFYVTEDGYPWDMSELAQAISSNGGVMRNPLSHQMFTTNDIRAIVQHPLGKHLAALEIEQKKLKLGIHAPTHAFETRLNQTSADVLVIQGYDQQRLTT